MQLIIQCNSNALTVEEAVNNAKGYLGKDLRSVKVIPDGNCYTDFLYFGIQQRITAEQLSLLFDAGPLYNDKLQELRKTVLDELEDLVNTVIQDVERKVLE